MGLFWELFQEYQIGRRKREGGTLDERVAALEQEIDFLESILEKTFAKLEQLTGEDFDGDGQVNPA